MTWNYRIIKRYTPGDDSYEYGIYEIYYGGDGCGELITELPMAPYGEKRGELISEFTNMLGAFLKPVLNYEDF